MITPNPPPPEPPPDDANHPRPPPDTRISANMPPPSPSEPFPVVERPFDRRRSKDGGERVGVIERVFRVIFIILILIVCSCVGGTIFAGLVCKPISF